MTTLDDHHIRYYLQHDHPVAVCVRYVLYYLFSWFEKIFSLTFIQTDDTLPFRTSLVGEYALLLAARPLGMGLSEAEVQRIAEMGMAARFG